MAPGGMLLFNVDDGYLEGILRGYRSVSNQSPQLTSFLVLLSESYRITLSDTSVLDTRSGNL